jgi:hypothetical protein
MQKALAIIASNAPTELEYTLTRDGFDVLSIPPSPRLAPPVRSHSDMLIFPIGDTIFCHKSFAKENEVFLSHLRARGYNIRGIGGEYREDYPHDVRFNAAIIGKRIFIGFRTEADEICAYAIENGFEIIRVRQGYTKCSTCIVSENAIITADATIEKAARDIGIDVLRISDGHVDLHGYSHGFIGGASGAFSDTVYFTGDPRLHPDGDKILEFCQKHGKKVSFMEGKKLFDIGSILFLSDNT